MAITCSFCGTEIQDNENVFPFCGTAMENASAPVVEEVKPAPEVIEENKPAPVVEEVKPTPVAVTPAPAMEESKFVCTGCGKEYPAGTKFCAECGGKVEEKKPVAVKGEIAPKFACTGCGKEYPAGTKFCSECGGKIKEKSAAPKTRKNHSVNHGQKTLVGDKVNSGVSKEVEKKKSKPKMKSVKKDCNNAPLLNAEAEDKLKAEQAAAEAKAKAEAEEKLAKETAKKNVAQTAEQAKTQENATESKSADDIAQGCAGAIIAIIFIGGGIALEIFVAAWWCKWLIAPFLIFVGIVIFLAIVVPDNKNKNQS